MRDTQVSGTSLKVDENPTRVQDKTGFHPPSSWYWRTVYHSSFSAMHVSSSQLPAKHHKTRVHAACPVCLRAKVARGREFIWFLQLTVQQRLLLHHLILVFLLLLVPKLLLQHCKLFLQGVSGRGRMTRAPKNTSMD